MKIIGRNIGLKMICGILIIVLAMIVLIQSSLIRKAKETPDCSGIAFCMQNLYSNEMIILQQITAELSGEKLSEQEIDLIRGKVSTITVTGPNFTEVYKSCDDSVQELLADEIFFNEIGDSIRQLKEYCIRLQDTLAKSGTTVNMRDLMEDSEFRQLNVELNEEINSVSDCMIVDLKSESHSMKLNKTEQEIIMIPMRKIKELSEKLCSICYEYSVYGTRL